MAKQRIGEHLKKHKAVYITIGVATVIAALFVCYYCFDPVLQAERGENIQQMYKDMNTGYSILVETESEAEKKAMERVVRTYNRDKGYRDEYDKYRIFELTQNEFYISSQRVLNAELSLTAGKYFWCLGDMAAGIQTEEEQFLFVYTGLEGETLYQMVKSQSKIAEEDIEISEEVGTYGELTIVLVTVKPKNNFVAKGTMSPSYF